MALPDFSMRQLLEAGCHFGHQTHRWNPKMDRYIFGSRNGIHIIDLAQTVPLLHQALKLISDTVANGGRILFVGTKRQASELIADAAQRSAQYYVNARWLGGMLTNWSTISQSIKRLRQVSEMLEGGGAEALTKKERLMLTREREKLERALGGIKEMGGTPDLLFVIDTNKEAIAVQEARKLKIPVVAILDSNCDPQVVDHAIPGNDDAARAISLYCELAARAAIDGIARQQSSAGVDVGASEAAPAETMLDEAVVADSGGDLEQARELAKAPATAAEIVVEEPAEPASTESTEEESAKAAEKIDPAKATEKKEPAEATEKKEPTEATEKEEPAGATEKEEPAGTAGKEKAAEKAGKEKAAAATDGKKASETAGKKKPAEPGPTKAETKGASTGNDDGPLFDRPSSEPDDLKKIAGVGPVLEGKLHELGITKFEQIAKFSPEDVARVDERLNFKGRIERDNWIKQAAEFASENA